MLNISFRTADSRQLRRLFRMLRHTVDVPSADKLRRDLKIRAELEKDKIKEELASVKKVSLALDR